MGFSPTVTPVVGGSVGDVLKGPIATDPNRVAVVASNGSLTYADLDTAADRAAAVLYARGVRRGDVIAVSLPNKLEIVVVFHALMRLGAVFLGINRNLAPTEKHFMLSDSRATLILADPAEVESIQGPTEIPGLAVGADGHSLWHSASDANSSGYDRPSCELDDPAGIAYTSGTTGRPKGVVHSHRNLLLASAGLVADRGYDSDLRRGDCSALTILNLQVTSTLLAAQAGGTQIVIDRVDPAGIAQWIRRERINSWFGVPTMLHGLATSPDVAVRDLESLTDIWTGGSDLPAAVRQAFEARFEKRVHATYGMTEVPAVATIEERSVVGSPQSSGRPLAHLQIEIRQPDGSLTPTGQPGEIVVLGRTHGPRGGLYRPMLEYLGHAEATQTTIRDGCLYTGDIGHLDDGGRLHVVDRRSTLILRGGANVYPAEVERVIMELQGVIGCAVFGIDDDRLGQRVAAVVQLAPASHVTTDALASHCRLHLARYKVPEMWRFAELPRNAMGKVIRTALADLIEGG